MYDFSDIQKEAPKIPIRDLPSDITKTRSYIRQHDIFIKMKNQRFFASKDNWKIRDSLFDKGDLVWVAELKLSHWDNGHLYTEFLFIHNDVVLEIKIPITNWGVWFAPLEY